ncbi:MAG: hypothetical protein QXR98_04240 [Fervidicoccaceae archaeon]
MSSEDELKNILNKLISELLSRASSENEAYIYEVNPTSPNGIYFLNDGHWKLYRVDGLPLHPGEQGDGIYAFYFDNTKCGACRRFDREWFPFVEKNATKAKFFIILCDWFARECSSKAASLTFTLNEVRASPTTIFFKVLGGEIKEQERIEGVVQRQKLEEVLERLISK